jgi:hypothetical protein
MVVPFRGSPILEDGAGLRSFPWDGSMTFVIGSCLLLEDVVPERLKSHPFKARRCNPPTLPQRARQA